MRARTAWTLVLCLAAAGCESTSSRPAPPARAAAPAEPPDIGQQVTTLAQHSRPDEHHRELDVLAGDWDVTLSGAGPDGKVVEELARGRASIRWILGGRFQRWSSTMEIAGHASTTAGFLGYDKVHGQYQLMMISDLVSSMEVASGRGSLREGIWFALDPSLTRGRSLDIRSILRLVDADTFVVEQLAPGPDDRERVDKRAVYRRSRGERAPEEPASDGETAPGGEVQGLRKGVSAVGGRD